MSVHGLVAGVRADPLGDQLTQAAAGATLTVNDVADFAEEGGWLALNGQILAYITCDDDTSTITLASTYVGTSAAGDQVTVWDAANNQPVVDYVAVVDDGDDFDPIEASVDQSLAGTLAQTMRDGKGEGVSLVRDGANLKVAAVHGRNYALAALQYLQGGMTTRADETQAGIDIVGTDAEGVDGVTPPGIYGYDADGGVTVRIDALTGDATFIGELGTADPGEVGIFMFSNKFSYKGVQHTRPVIQLNTGASRDQPSIQADAAGDGSGISVYSGASTGQRESHMLLDAGTAFLGIERTADSDPDYGTYLSLADDSLVVAIHKGSGTGGLFELTNDAIILQTDYEFGANSLAAHVIGESGVFSCGYRDNSNGRIQGMWLAPGGDVVLSTQGSVDVQNPVSSAFQAVNASAFNVSSGAASKADIRDAPDALGIIAKAPAKRWRYKDEPKSKTHLGPVADDLPRYLVGRRGKKHPVDPDGQYVNVPDLVGVLWAAVGQQQEQIDALTARIASLEQNEGK